MRGFLKSVSSDFSAQVVSTIITIPGMILLARIVGSSILGQYFLLIATLNLLSISLDFGIGASIVRYERERMSGEFLTGGIALRTLILFALFPIVLGLNSHLRSYFGFDFAYPLLALFTVEQIRGTFGHMLVAENKVAINTWIYTIQTWVKFISQLLLVTFLPSPRMLVAGHIFASSIALLLLYSVLESSLALPSRKDVLKLIEFGLKDYFNGLETFGAEWIDSLILGYLMSPSIVGVYEISWSVSSKLFVGSRAIVKSLYPRLIQSEVDNNEENSLNFRNQSLIFVAVLIFPGFVGLAILGKEILSLYGPEFTSGYYAVLVLTTGRLFQSIDSVFTAVFRAKSMPWKRAKASPFLLGVNVALNILLIPHLGILGACIATMSSLALGPVIGIKEFGFDFERVGPRWVGQCFSSIVMGIVIFALKPIVGSGIFPLVSLMLIGVMIYIICLHIFDSEIREITLRVLVNLRGDYL